MSENTRKLIERALGGPTIGSAGLNRTIRGLRTGERRELYLGLGLAAFAYLRRTAPSKKLLYSKRLKPGSAVVIHHRGSGDPRIEVITPD